MVVFSLDFRERRYAMANGISDVARPRLNYRRKSRKDNLAKRGCALGLFLAGLTLNSLAETSAIPVSLYPPVVTNAVTNSTVALLTVAAPLVTSVTDAPVVFKAPVSSATERPDYSKYIALFISFLALAYTVWKDLRTGKRMKKIETQQELEKQEAAIRRSKASAPYFSPSKELFSMLYETDDNGNLGGWNWNNANVLTIRRREMPQNAPEGTPVLIILDTNKKSARRLVISGDISGFELKQEPETQGGENRVFLKYPYKPAHHGKSQRVILSFETEDGFDLTHTYETRHGCFEFHRIDPK